MEPKIKVQKDYYVTEVSIELPADIQRLDEILRAMKSTGKLVIQYNQGCIQGINVEQRTKISDAAASKIRPLLEIGEVVL